MTSDFPTRSAAFEENVRELLRLSGYHVEPEFLLRHKKLDTYAEERRMGSRRRIAVECKDYAGPLTQEHVTQIIANYLPLYDANDVDEILLITRRGVTPSAEAMIDGRRAFFHLTLAELQNTVIDFSSHLTSIQHQVHDDGLADYYVKPKLRDDSDLDEVIRKWIDNGTKPIAILGSYGMGKTSFVRHFAAELAGIAARDVSARIPVIVRLSDISSEQSLEGLLGKLFTTTAHVRNYTFEGFMALNRIGRFVIFLDGFDEMKHALSWEQFRYNFKELNRLVTGNSRVVLLGRPSAFLSDAEYQYVLHGIKRTVAGVSREVDWPDFDEIELQLFRAEQVREFLTGYGRHLVKLGTVDVSHADPDYILTQINRLPKGRLADVASRPVQLRILSEVLPQWSGDAADLTPVKLYSAFIDIVIEREQEKITRRRFDATARRTFARELAYWLWTSKASTSIDGSRIPDYLFPEPAEGESIDGVKRDMLAACFLERKLGNMLYFPHRSFQEFLIAEKMLLDVRLRSANVSRMSDAANPEVAEFLCDMSEDDDIHTFDILLKLYRGSVRLSLLSGWTKPKEYIDLITTNVPEKISLHPWHRVWLTVLAAGGLTSLSTSEVMRRVLSRLRDADRRDGILAIVCGVALLQSASDDDQPKFVVAIWQALQNLYETGVKALISIRPQSAHPNPLGIFARSSALEAKFLSEVKVVKNASGAVSISFYRAVAFACQELVEYAMVEEWHEEAVRYATTRAAYLFKPSAAAPRELQLAPYLRDEPMSAIEVLELWWRRTGRTL